MHDWRAFLAAKGLPDPPEGEIENVRWRMRHDDWYVLITGKGWFWLDARQGWMPSVYGPD